MSNKRIITLPLAGIDARPGLNINPETTSAAVNVRASEEDLRDYSYMRTHVPSPSGSTETARNVVQYFMAPPGGIEGISDRNRVVMLTTASAWELNNSTSTWVQKETGYALKPVTIFGTGGTTWPRFAIANSQHKLVWTCAQSHTDIRVRVYDGTTITPIAQNYAARHMIAFNNRIVIADTVEDGTRNSSRLRWCVNRNFLDWTGEGSGFLDVSSFNSSGRIMALNIMGNSAILALEREFIELDATNSLFPVFQLGQHYTVPPIVAPRSWAVYNDIAFYLGPDSVYAWTKGGSVEKIGKPIERLLAPYMVPERMDSIQASILMSRGEYRLLMTMGITEGDFTSVIFIFDIKAGRWFEQQRQYQSTIGRAVVIWQGGETFNPTGHLPGTLEFAMGANRYDALLIEAAPDINRVVPLPSFTTQDILAINSEGAPDVNVRNELINLYFRTLPNFTIAVGYSTNRGVSFVNRTVTANSEGQAIFSERISFSTLRFTFFASTPSADPFVVTGPIVMEWDQIGTIY